MKIYTKTGDDGETSLRNGVRVKKFDCLIEVLGNLDELNCVLGLSINFIKTKEAKRLIPKIQNSLFNMGSEISLSTQDSYKKISENEVKELEFEIDEIEKKLSPLKAFILPDGKKGGSFIHLARAVCRRSERSLTKYLIGKKIKSPVLSAYINRLSDFLFVLGRLENKITGKKETLWKKL